MIDRVVVASQWIGDGLNPSQIATTMRVSAPGRYEIELPTREQRTGRGDHRTVGPTHLIVEIAPPKTDLCGLARRLIEDAPRWEGCCVFCGEDEDVDHADSCVVSEVTRTLAMIDVGLL